MFLIAPVICKWLVDVRSLAPLSLSFDDSAADIWFISCRLWIVGGFRRPQPDNFARCVKA